MLTPLSPRAGTKNLFGLMARAARVDSAKFHEACTVFAAAAMANDDYAQVEVFISALRLKR